MRLLINLKIKYKLIVMLMLPIMVFLGFTTSTVVDKSITAKNMAALEQVTALSIKVSDVVHSVQKERAQTLFLGNNGNLLTEQLSQEYVSTDQSIGVLKTFLESFDFSYYPTNFVTKVESMLQTVEKLGSIRTLATKTTENDQILSQYTDLNDQLLDFIATSNKLDNGNVEIFKLTRVYTNILVVREKASLETLVGKIILTQQQLTSDQYRQLIELEAHQTIYLTRNILLQLNEAQRTFFEQTIANPVVTDVETMRQTFYDAIKDNSALQQISVENWSNKQNSRAELLKAIEERLAIDLHDAASQLRTEAKQSFNILLSIGIVIVILVAWFTTFIVNNITSTLGKAVTVAKAIAQRNLNNEIEITGKDEINQLLQELAEMQSQLRTQLEEEKSITQQALRINNALDNATTNVVITDDHFDVIYLNKAAQQLFKTEESVIQTKIPHFNATQLLYSNADKYHRNPQHQHQILDHLTGTHRSRVTIADITLDHIISPIDDQEGNRLGFVIEFHNRSSEVAIEQEINQVIHAASNGNFEQRVALEGKIGFFKMLGESINKILEVNRLAVIDTMRIFSALAKGDLTQTITRDYFGAFEQLKNDANATVQRLTEVVATIQQTANAVDNAANDISNGNMSLTQRTEEQAASLEQTAASMEQMTSTVQQNADNARQASQLALSAKERAELGGKVVNAAVVAVSAINSSSQKVADIIGVIDDIAFQTNLLALNAAVEAARAGEQGRGFAVVATEVRHLAQRSATAAKEIKQLIRDSVDKVEEGTKLVNQSGSTLEDIVIAVKKVSDIIAEISAASQEQSAGIHQVNKAITQMDEMTQQNAALVSQAMSVNNVMIEQVKTLQQQIAFFKVNNLGEKKKKEKIAQNTPPALILPKTASRHNGHEQGWEDF